MGTRNVQSLKESLDLSPKEMLAIVGAGGKSTLMLSLSRELRKGGKKVLASTTTKVWQEQALAAGSLVLTRSKRWRDRLKEALEKPGPEALFLGGRLLENGKVEGVDPELLDWIFTSDLVDCVLVEADGAAGRPLKAPEPFEPVIPSKTTSVVAMLGLEALGKHMGEDLVFRSARFQEITGLKPGDTLAPRALSRLFVAGKGLFQGSPEGARRIAFLNKLDLAEDEKEVALLAARILESGAQRDMHVVLGSLETCSYRRMTREKSHG